MAFGIGGDVDRALAERRAVLRRLHRALQVGVQPFDERFDEGRFRLEGDDGRRAIGREIGKERRQRVDPAHRGAARHDAAVPFELGIDLLLVPHGLAIAHVAVRGRQHDLAQLADRLVELFRRGAQRLGKHSTAPSSNALSEVSVPACVRLDSMTTGSGLCSMISSRNSIPLMPGISTSSVITFGRSASIWSRASAALAAAPTTRTFFAWSRISENSARIAAESSTTRTLASCICLQTFACRRAQAAPLHGKQA
jgi:hypothetical protein